MSASRWLQNVRASAVALGMLFAMSCSEDKTPSFPDGSVSDMTSSDVVVTDSPSSDTADETDDLACNDHDDCDQNELCVNDECEDRSSALSSCNDTSDCPDGFACIDSDFCEED